MSAPASADGLSAAAEGFLSPLWLVGAGSASEWLQQLGVKASNESLYNRYDGGLYRLSYVPGLTQAEEAFAAHLDALYAFFTEGGGFELGVLLGALYLLLIFSLQAHMEGRARLELRRPLVLWNASLALFSLVGVCRTLPELVDAAQVGGFAALACDARFMRGGPGFWAWLFAMSKVPEMGDTLFIVLRKQKLIFLHWYHHLATMLYTWLCFVDWAAPARLFMVMNYGIHALMYAYYAGRALRWRIPRWVNVVITTVQLSQMLVGFVMAGWAWEAKAGGQPCQVSYLNLELAYLMYFSYILLFGNFFYHSYIKRKPPGGAAATTSPSITNINQQESTGLAGAREGRNRYGAEVRERHLHGCDARQKE